MITNGIEIPDPGVTTEYIKDPIGGWIYRITTVVSVEQQNAQQFDKALSDAKEQLTAAQTKVAELEAQKLEVATVDEEVKP